jgi:putative ABC transport system substrate-binding protein
MEKAMKRREFVTLLGGAAACPLAARAQQGEKVRRIGFVHDYVGSDPEGRRQAAAFREALQKLGWTEGQNVQIDYRSGAADNDLLRTYAAEVVSVVLAFSRGRPHSRKPNIHSHFL